MRNLLKVKQLVVVAVLSLVGLSNSALALIQGGEGNNPIADPGWPSGTAEIFNHKGRIAWWEGPPLGGGEWHSECKGDASALNEVLKLFAKIEGPKKRLVVLDGIGYSFWLDPNGAKRGDRNTKIDWSFAVWQADRWKIQQEMPPGMSAIPNNQLTPIATITVYTASLRWSEVQVPKGIEVIDNRLEAHGFNLNDGRVIEGKVTAEDGKPLRAKIRVEELLPKKTGYEYAVLSTIDTDKDGHWYIKNFGEKWCRIVVECDGYASRIAGHVRYDRQPGWEFMSTELAQRGSIQGRVVDEDGKPLADASVAMRDLVANDGSRYDSIEEVFQKSAPDGSFHFKDVPIGKARLTGHRDDYFFPGLGQEVTSPGASVELRMSKAASIVIQLEFAGDRDKTEFIANLTPEGGEKVGSWGGSAKIDDKDTARFKGVPPGRYLLNVRPNPSNGADQLKEQIVELKGGEETKVVVKASAADQ